MSSLTHLDLASLLAPIPGPSAAGSPVARTQDYSRLRQSLYAEAEPRDPSGAFLLDPRGRPQCGNLKPVIAQAVTILASQSKDLTVAVWLTEALSRTHGFAGFREGLRLLWELHERFWDDLHPLAEDGDLEGRANALSILTKRERVLSAVLFVPLTAPGEGRGPYDCQHWRDAQLNSPEKVTLEAFEALLAATPDAFFATQGQWLDACREELHHLDRVVGDRYAAEGPSLEPLFKAVDDCLAVVNRRRPKASAAPHPVGLDTSAMGEVPGPVGLDTTVLEGAPSGQAAVAPQGLNLDFALETPTLETPLPGLAEAEQILHGGSSLHPQGWEPASVQEVPGYLARLARFVLSHDYRNPLSYLMIRLYRWGELRVHAPKLACQLLHPPSTQTRITLRKLREDGRWLELLAASESAMSRPEGRGWLDLQWYSYEALRHLGSEGVGLARVLATETRQFVEELPELIQAELLDGTPACSQEVRLWLETEVLSGGASQLQSPPPPAAVTLSPLEEAKRLQRQGRLAEALAVMQEQLSQARSGRDRFLAQLDLAELLIQAERREVARALLLELGELAEQRQLLSWESPEVCGRLWRAQYLCREAGSYPPDGDEYAQKLFEQLCRLDIAKAIACIV